MARVILGWDRAAIYPIAIPLALDALRGSATGEGNVGEPSARRTVRVGIGWIILLLLLVAGSAVSPPRGSAH